MFTHNQNKNRGINRQRESWNQKDTAKYLSTGHTFWISNLLL